MDGQKIFVFIKSGEITALNKGTADASTSTELTSAPAKDKTPAVKPVYIVVPICAVIIAAAAVAVVKKKKK